MFPEDQDYPLCEEHARANALSLEASEWEVVEEVTGEWLRIAGAWGIAGLEQLALNVHEEAKEKALVAEARAGVAIKIAEPRAPAARTG